MFDPRVVAELLLRDPPDSRLYELVNRNPWLRRLLERQPATREELAAALAEHAERDPFFALEVEAAINTLPRPPLPAPEPPKPGPASPRTGSMGGGSAHKPPPKRPPKLIDLTELDMDVAYSSPMFTGDERFLVAEMPGRAPLLAELSVVVRICVRSPNWPATWAQLPAEAVPPGTKVSVLAQPPAGLSVTGPLEQVLTIPETGDTDPVRFAFRAAEPGLHRVRVMAFAGGTFLAELEIEVSVEVDGPAVEGKPVVAFLDQVRAREGEVTLQVRTDGGNTVFQLLSDTYLFEPVQAAAGDPSAAVERAIDTLRQLAQGRGPYTGGTARRWMQETGIGLWNAAVPELIKEQYWQLRDQITSFTIATSHDLIPWELLYPLRPGGDHGFLVEQFPVLRRVFGQSRARLLTLVPHAAVLSARSPDNAWLEVDAVARILDGGTVIEELDELLDVIAEGRFGSLHFVCHNSFDANGSSIAMSGGTFVPGLLNSAATRRPLVLRSPVVFINACRTAGSVPEYSRMTGWAQQFMAAGAGAFLGTLWPVRSDSARTFAEICYARLRAGDPLGSAVQQARTAAGKDDPDPTWLAYTVYGDPHAVVL